VLDIGADVSVPADGDERDAALAFLDCLGLPAQVGQGQAPENVPLAIVGRGPELIPLSGGPLISASSP
jgi:hypothetical protein